MRRRIRCLWHKESTPSLVQYKDHWKCFGACHKSYTNKEVEERTGESFDYDEKEDEEKEDLKTTFEYINSLPKKHIRGVLLPYDERGYYIVWGHDEYSKFRQFNPGKGQKYIGPKGHYPPLFWARHSGSSILFIIEGEVNALSVAQIVSGDVCSPGSASMFNTDRV